MKFFKQHWIASHQDYPVCTLHTVWQFLRYLACYSCIEPQMAVAFTIGQLFTTFVFGLLCIGAENVQTIVTIWHYFRYSHPSAVSYRLLEGCVCRSHLQRSKTQIWNALLTMHKLLLTWRDHLLEDLNGSRSKVSLWFNVHLTFWWTCPRVWRLQLHSTITSWPCLYLEFIISIEPLLFSNSILSDEDLNALKDVTGCQGLLLDTYYGVLIHTSS